MTEKTVRDYYTELIGLEHNRENIDNALDFLDKLIVFSRALKAERTSIDGMQQRIKAMAEEVMVELGTMKEETEHGKVYWRSSGSRKSVDVSALDAIAAKDARFAELYRPHRKETEGKRALIVG